ncbi:MAG: tetratricopeptide repeat protein [Deltaproteobacteria bacterium]|nr:tetratricopeptide repeat protein [Deltaproteobacteria bacterium]
MITFRDAMSLLCLCAIVMSLIPSWAPCETLEEGIEALKAGYDTMALPKLQEAIRILQVQAAGPDEEGSAHYHLARAFEGLAIYHTNQGGHDEALHCLEDGIADAKIAIERTPTASRYHTVLGNLFGELAAQSGIIGKIRNGRLAAASYARALELDPRNALAHVGAGIGKLETPAAFGGSFADALIEFRTAQALDSACDEAWTWEGIALRRHGSIAEARHAFTKALEVNPRSDHAQRELAALEEDF